jgi:two-component system, NtrC family, sensor histidine kinase HydH
MNRNLLLRVTAPAIAVGLLLLVASSAGVWYIYHIQRNLAGILSENVTSLQAAQELELAVRQLRFHSLLYLMDPGPSRISPIELDEKRFDTALALAQQWTTMPDDQQCVQKIADGYAKFQTEQARLRAAAVPGQPAAELHTLVDTHPIRSIADSCQELLQINKVRMERTAENVRKAAIQGIAAIVILGLLGPIGGLLMGYGVARGLKQSIYRLSVRVQDMAQHLSRDVATVNVVADGDFQSLDQRMQEIVRQVEEVASRLHRQTQELLRAEQLAAVGQLAAGVAHEVRNPLAGIKMLVEATHRAEKPRPLNANDVKLIERELNRVERTVQGLLDYARLPTPLMAPCDLTEVVNSAYSVIRAKAEKQGVAVRLQGTTASAIAVIDRDQIHNVFVNLMLNALDAMPEGGQLDVSWKATELKTIELSVVDNGSGIPDEVAKKMFTPFATTKPTGTGLGLYLVNRILAGHGGTITASNRAEGGACFVLSLPEPVMGTST